MTERPRTLVFVANGFGWREHAADTVLLGLFGLKDYQAVPRRLRAFPLFRGLKARYDALGYANDWRDAFAASPALDVTVCNVTNLADYARSLRRIGEFDLVVVLHTALGDSTSLLLKTAARYRKRGGKLAVFIGNEYDLMADKFRFLEAADADYICTQLPIESALWLYTGVADAEVLAMPHALNPLLYSADGRERSRDVGFVGAVYPPFIGDVERTLLIEEVEVRARERGLRCEFRTVNVPRAEWAAFLKESEGTVGCESGSYYLDREGLLIRQAKEFLTEHPAAPFEELYERFFERPSIEYVSGKCISSRHFEAAGTRTCQILLAGEYNGILEAGEHYISVERDLSNLDDAIALFEDPALRREVADRAHEHVLSSHTYARRVDALVSVLGA
ncbi:MAG: glycosyltransferase family protein [Solirubrobacteraceae bacterium]